MAAVIRPQTRPLKTTEGMNEKEQQLVFDKGITNIPSDALCSDNTLSESLGMVYENGEHHVIQRPEEYINAATYETIEATGIPALVYIHRFNNKERFVGYITNGLMVWGVKNGKTLEQKGTFTVGQVSFNYEAGMQITSIGKTLIITKSDGVHYYLWKEGVYKSLGNAFPRPGVEFKLTNRDGYIMDPEGISCDGIIQMELIDGRQHYHIKLDKQEDWNNAVVGLYARLRKKVWEKKRFHGSFCVRAALMLYDGTYYHIENPVFMLNHFNAKGLGAITANSKLFLQVWGQELMYRFSKDYTEWSDIVKSVVLFVTKEAPIYDTTSDQPCTPPDFSHYPSIESWYMGSPDANTRSALHTAVPPVAPNDYGSTLHYVLKPEEDSDLDNVIKDGVYYKLCEIGMKGDGNWHNASDHFDTHTIENITTQEQLGEDDFYSHCPFKPGLVYAYNARLNMANVWRGFFEGFDFFMPFDNTTEATYTFYVTIATDGGEKVVSHTVTTKQKQGLYFYYPDARAKHVVIKKGSSVILNEDLTEHPTLNGAYYFAGVSTSMDEPSGAGASAEPQPTGQEKLWEFLPNTIITSEANNPYVFKAQGYNNVGVGRVIGMSTVTQALSEGQFGQFPLLVFATDGIWALTVDSKGLYSSVHPMSREVCNNARTIVQTDGAVYFSSTKGLMVIVGSQVRCVSEQLSGKTDMFNDVVDMGGSLVDYLSNEGCSIGYDYRRGQLWILSNQATRPNGVVNYVYNIKAGTFGKYEGQQILSRAVNNYPDYLLQDEDGVVYSMLSRPEAEDDGNIYSGMLITRPMKLENGLSLKSILQMRHVTDFKDYEVIQEGQTTTAHGKLTLHIYASNNLREWVELKSLRGMPWKYYRLKYVLTGLKATDTFGGTVVVTQVRRNGKLR